MDKLKMMSMDKVQGNIEKIRALFPNAVTEVLRDGKPELKVDFDVLKQELANTLIDDRELRYQFTWPDKQKSVLLANTPVDKTLRPCKEESVDFDTTQNLYIEGDNLEVLKLLQETYLGKIKMIYIDPPYNTGNDFVYNDDFAQDSEEYLECSGQFDEQGNRLVLNTESNGRFHTDWLNMIYPRLRLAKDLLSDDGVIFISIDDNEVDNLRKVCDEVFGENNFVAQIVWRKIYGIKNDVKTFSNCHEYIVVYSKVLNGWMPNLLPRTNEANSRYKNPDNDPRGDWKAGDFTGVGATSCVYPIITPSGKTLYPPEGKHWIASKENYEKLRADNRIWFGSNGDSVPSIKRFLSEVKNGMSPSTFVDYTEVGHTDEANRSLKQLLEGAFFDYPKPVRLLNRLLFLGTNTDDIVLDFYSGSATTAHAVMQLNAEDGGKRKFIMVQLPEPCDEKSEAYKAGYKNICEIGKERIRRAGKKILAEHKAQSLINSINIVDETHVSLERPFEEIMSDDSLQRRLDIGFRVLKLDTSNMQPVYYNPEEYSQTLLDDLTDNIKADRTPLDLLFQVMLDLGKPLSAKIEEKDIAGKHVFIVNDDDLIACFDSNVTEETVKAIAQLKPLYAVFRDSSLANDSTAANFDQIFATYSPNTIRKVL